MQANIFLLAINRKNNFDRYVKNDNCKIYITLIKSTCSIVHYTKIECISIIEFNEKLIVKAVKIHNLIFEMGTKKLAYYLGLQIDLKSDF